jgi:hypothetical protein
MEARIAEDREVAKETVLGQVTRVIEEKIAKDEAEAAAEKKAKEEAEATAVMKQAEQIAEKKEEQKPVAKTDAAAEALAAAKAAAEISEADMAADMKAKAEPGAGLTRAHQAAGEERQRIEEEKEAKAVEKAETVAEPKPGKILVKHSPAASHGKIKEVFAYRVFKNNRQWCVEWTADNTVSWESFDKIDSDHLREKALALEKAEI